MDKARGILSLAGQAVSRRLWPGKTPKIFYIAPNADWIIDWIGRYLTTILPRKFNVQAEIISEPKWQIGQILHYGTLWSYLGNLGTSHNARNSVVATVFHGFMGKKENPFNEALDKLVANQGELAKLVTASTLMRDRFISWGIDEHHIATIPLGIDLAVFKPAGPSQKKKIRQQLGIDNDAFCIGSFHKDGIGWDQGFEPKLIKGPDVFLKVIEKLKQSVKLHILLTAPARGFVKRGLDNLNVPYTHHILDNYYDIANYYHALDAYLVPSREEGGPLGVLEALATGIPLISTRVGLAPDIVTHGVDALLSQVEEVNDLAENMYRIVEDLELRRSMEIKGLETIQAYDWQIIAARYYKEVYKPLVETRPE